MWCLTIECEQLVVNVVTITMYSAPRLQLRPFAGDTALRDVVNNLAAAISSAVQRYPSRIDSRGPDGAAQSGMPHKAIQGRPRLAVPDGVWYGEQESDAQPETTRVDLRRLHEAVEEQRAEDCTLPIFVACDAC